MSKQNQLVLFPETNEPTFTRTEWDEIQRFRMARMLESGEKIPSLEELLTAMRNAVRKARANKR